VENKNQQTNIISENKGRGLFYGVIAIATFIIMAVGATFAYFTASTNSMNAAVQTGSTTLELEYISYGSAWSQKDLIPADHEVVEYSFEVQNDTTVTNEENLSNTLCKDDFGNSICSVYVFQVKNSANSPQTVSLNVVSEVNGFSALNAMTYEISLPEDRTNYDSTEDSNGTGDPVFRKNSADETEDAIDVVDGKGTLIEEDAYDELYVNRKGITKTLLKVISSRDEEAGTVVKAPAINIPLVAINETNQYSDAEKRTAKVAEDITIDGGQTKTFALVLYIRNANVDQTGTDAKKTFSGQMVVKSGDGLVGVSGSIGAIGDEQKDDLQSNQTPTDDDSN